jgi:hypothetical protein
MGKARRNGEVLPTEPIDEHLLTAFDDISATEDGPSQFGMMFDGNRFDAVRPVFYEPVYYAEDELMPVSQRILYSTQVRSKPRAQQQLIDAVDDALSKVSVRNPVKRYRDSVAGVTEAPGFFENVSEAMSARQSRQSPVIGGLLMVKCAGTNQVGLRCVYSKALMEITGWLDEQVGTAREAASDEVRVRDLSALMAMSALDQSVQRRPAIVTIPNTVGFQGI